jgi:anhydro-N-acetylmuramic acid kinase
MQRMRVIGLMSGTSMDGIDAAIVTIQTGVNADDISVELEAYQTIPYPEPVRATLVAITAGDVASRSAKEVLRDLCALNFAIGDAFASAAIAIAGAGMASIDLIGSHGQTIYHLPDDDGRPGFVRSTLQIGEAAVIAARTGITTVADFRVADVAAGGHGAPLVSYVDYLLLRDAREDRAALNIGGIANLTVLPAGCGFDEVRAFDIGPGNMLIDQAVSYFSGGGTRYDDRGAIAASGGVCTPLLKWLSSHPYFARGWPKTTGREDFGDAYFRSVLDQARGFGADAAETIATLTESTARSIADAVPARTERVIVSGGGANNDTLLAALRSALEDRSPSPPVVSLSGEFGIPPDAKEALAFALLAHQTVRGQCANVPAATGAGRPVILGKIAPGENFAALASLAAPVTRPSGAQ